MKQKQPSKKQQKSDSSPAASEKKEDVAGTRTQSSVPLRSKRTQSSVPLHSKEKKEIKKKETQIQELTSLLKKVQADFENYKKRIEKEQERFVGFACQNMVKEMLPVLDSFELAIKNTKNRDIEQLYSQLWRIFSSQGLSKIKALNQKFDPYLHEALMQENSDKPDGTIIEELQSGYMFRGDIIRPTKVKVSKNENK